jgi:hypothetical protein
MYLNYGLEFMLDVTETIMNAANKDSDCKV